MLQKASERGENNKMLGRGPHSLLVGSTCWWICHDSNMHLVYMYLNLQESKISAASQWLSPPHAQQLLRPTDRRSEPRNSAPSDGKTETSPSPVVSLGFTSSREGLIGPETNLDAKLLQNPFDGL